MIPAIIITMPRSGSQMLFSALQTHPELTICAWPWDDNDLIRQAAKFYAEAGKGCRVLITHHNWANNWSVNHCGMAIDTMWRRLAEITSGRAILLRRDNYLKRYLSIKITEKLGISVAVPRTKHVKVDFNPEEFMVRMSHSYKCWRRVMSIFPEAKVLTYKDLCDDWHNAIRASQVHLGLQPMLIKKLTCQQETRMIADIVSNYGEMERFFQTEMPWQEWIR